MRVATAGLEGGVLVFALLVGGWAGSQGSSPTPKATPGGTGGLPQLVPPGEATEGWIVSGQLLTYSPVDLFEYLDGGAPRYLGYGFARLVQARYVRADPPGGEPEAGVTLDLYDMGDALGAFGIYSSARPPGVAPREWCVEGYRSGPVAAAWKDRLYVHAAADDERPELVGLAERLVASVCARAPGDPSPPPLLAALPREGLVPRSERYVARDLLGHAFLPGGVLATYEIDGRRAEVFFSDLGTATAAREAIGRLRAHFGERRVETRAGPAVGDISLRHADGVLGPGTVVAAGRHVAGIHGDLPQDARERVLRRLVERLTGANGSARGRDAGGARASARARTPPGRDGPGRACRPRRTRRCRRCRSGWRSPG
jgi:hypothetical protein